MKVPNGGSGRRFLEELPEGDSWERLLREVPEDCPEGKQRNQKLNLANEGRSGQWCADNGCEVMEYVMF